MKKLKLNKPYIRKNNKIKINNSLVSIKSSHSNYCNFAIVTMTAFYWNQNTIEAGRKVISRLVKKEKKKNNPKCLTLVKHFGIPLTTKKKSRMGKGKGKINIRVCLLNENSVIYKLYNISELSMKKIMTHLKHKMPIKLKWFIIKD